MEADTHVLIVVRWFVIIDIEEASGIEDVLIIVLLVVLISWSSVVLDIGKTRPEVGPKSNLWSAIIEGLFMPNWTKTACCLQCACIREPTTFDPDSIGGLFPIVQRPSNFPSWQTHPWGISHVPGQFGCALHSVQLAPAQPFTQIHSFGLIQYP